MKFFSQHKPIHSFSRLGALSRKLAFIFLCSMSFSIYPVMAYAGFFSSISGILGISADNASADTVATSDAITSASVTSSSSITGQLSADVLNPATNSNPDPDTTTASTDIPVSDNAIMPEAASIANGTSTNPYLNTEISVYTVRPGDTLSEIAKLFNVSINTIIWANDLSASPTLTQGETLVILPITGINYTFKKGDTLQGVVKKYDANLDEVLQYNDITLSSVINVGDTIIIPDVEIGTPEISVNSSLGSKTTKPWNGKGIPPERFWGAPGEEPAHNTNGPVYKDYYDLPLSCAVETQGLHGYNAVDLYAPKGTPILASADGTVIISRMGGWNGGYGNYIVISHPNGTQTLYAHTSKDLVSTGEEVTQGQEIGLVGATGEATGPHVHFEIRGAWNPFVRKVGTQLCQ
jgi:murein DD-endopeptidase MepM/ murein hydrolase activator NlpD